jgi:hypothetical protein
MKEVNAAGTKWPQRHDGSLCSCAREPTRRCLRALHMQTAGEWACPGRMLCW